MVRATAYFLPVLFTRTTLPKTTFPAFGDNGKTCGRILMSLGGKASHSSAYHNRGVNRRSFRNEKYQNVCGSMGGTTQALVLIQCRNSQGDHGLEDRLE